jgi:spermidine/putrescine transport system substrate-binding protein
VQYVSPVVGVRDELVKLGGDAAALADSPLLFPSDEDKARLRVFGEMSEELDQQVTDRFISIIGG